MTWAWQGDAQLFDVAIEVSLYGSEFLTYANLLVEKALNLHLLLVAHQQRALVRTRRLKFTQGVLSVRELRLQTLLGLPELGVGLPTQRFYSRKGPGVRTARANTDQLRAAR